MGLLTIDLQFFVDQFPEENSKCKAGDFDMLIGGPATNAAATYAFLGGKTYLATTIGESPFNRMINDANKHSGVYTIDLSPEVASFPTFASVITNTKTGDRTIFSFHPDEPTFIKEHIANLPRCDILLVDGFHMNYAKAASRHYHQSKIPVVFDGGSWKKDTDKLLEYVDIAICSSNFHPPGTASEMEVLEYLTDKGVKKAAVTRGHEPIYFINQQKYGEIPINSRENIDTLGAGDIFHGAFCYYFLQLGDFTLALENAAEVASFSCRFPGTREWMKHFKGDHII